MSIISRANYLAKRKRTLDLYDLLDSVKKLDDNYKENNQERYLNRDLSKQEIM